MRTFNVKCWNRAMPAIQNHLEIVSWTTDYNCSVYDAGELIASQFREMMLAGWEVEVTFKC